MACLLSLAKALSTRVGMTCYNCINVLARPYLEFIVQFCSCDRKEVEMLEEMQKKFTRMLPGFESWSYRKRLIGWVCFQWNKGGRRECMVQVYNNL